VHQRGRNPSTDQDLLRHTRKRSFFCANGPRQWTRISSRLPSTGGSKPRGSRSVSWRSRAVTLVAGVLQSYRSTDGLTTAAGLWLTAAVGVAVGLGRETSTVLGMVLALLMLAVLPQVASSAAASETLREEAGILQSEKVTTTGANASAK
jgi:hypothetical protein